MSKWDADPICHSCGTEQGPFFNLSRCVECQREIWRIKHATRMADPRRAERRRKVLADYAVQHPRSDRR